MLNAHWRDTTLGSGTDAWKYWAERCAGNLCDGEWKEIENCIARSAGTCMTMGTASTMACIAEALGMTLPGASSIPAVVAEHSRLAVATGRLAVELAWTDRKPSRLLSAGSFINAMITQLAIGGSTNAIVHLIAMAGRAGLKVSLDDFDAWSRKVPVLANIRPSGKYLMEDFHRAGGLRALWSGLQGLLDTSAKQVDGRTLADSIAQSHRIDPDVIRTTSDPIVEQGGTCVLRGNLAPNGCVIKASASTARLLQHRGPAVVFENYPDLKKRIHDPDLPVTADSVLVLKDAGPLGAPGFPEWGMLPIPEKLLKAGVRDMVRISDARMSGTSYGTCVLHVSPESRLGGPLAWVQTGDIIELDVPARRISLLVSEEILAERKSQWSPAPEHASRGYTWLYTKHVTQADRGCDFDFLEGGDYGKEPDIF
jgi:dihydroxy-acid dehydratase